MPFGGRLEPPIAPKCLKAVWSYPPKPGVMENTTTNKSNTAKMNEKEHAAATKIQAIFRGGQCRYKILGKLPYMETTSYQ